MPAPPKAPRALGSRPYLGGNPDRTGKTGCIKLVQLSRNGTTAYRTESTRPVQSEDAVNGPSRYQKALYEGAQALDDLEPAT
ncbi:hypothetical protein EDB99_101411 [Pseudomonas sp. 460]|nr:hypothetical protein EDB99_101411 [Pseudomonas sp. 460]